MKSPVNIVLLAVLLSLGATWVDKKTIPRKQIIGAGAVTVFMSLLADAQPEVARPFSWLILSSVLGTYGADIFGTVGKLVGGDTNTVNPGNNSNRAKAV